jgi:predicted MFS family arabinose efflux permease
MQARASALAPFQVRSYRFQWPADLTTSWAFEMETIILGWYVLVETGSVFMLTVFASLQHMGTLIAPMFGVMGDRIGARRLLSIMRAFYALLATTLMVLAYANLLTPTYVLISASLLGLVRPSDIGMRAALVGQTMPPGLLMGAMSVQRTTMDSARIAGALTGAGLVAAMGIGPAYTVVASFYAISVALTLQAGSRSRDAQRRADQAAVASRPSPWRDLKEGLIYVRRTPHIFALMSLAFMLNATAFPLMNSLLPVVAKMVYQADQTWLGYMVAAAASGALTGSIVLSKYGTVVRPGRMMIVFSVLWYVMLIVFGNTQHPVGGLVVLVITGIVHSMGQIPMNAMLLRTTDERYRARVMGIRMLMIYGNMIGLLLFGPLIARIGYPSTATLYCICGIAVTILVALRWREHLWRIDALANRR